MVAGLNWVCRAVGEVGDEVLVQTPVYPPFLSAPTLQQRQLQTVDLCVHDSTSQQLYYGLDLTTFKAKLSSKTALFLLCHPHNPVGRVFSRHELLALAELCMENGTVICSDEIHCDLLLDAETMPHVPLASLSPEIAASCITLMAPSKTFNIAGLACSFAIVQNPRLRKILQRAAMGIMPEINVLGIEAALAGYQHGESWLQDLLIYLRGNRDYLFDFVVENMPKIRLTRPEATFLTWLDCRAWVADPYLFCLEKARVAGNEGQSFGMGYEGFLRLNFGCSRLRLQEALTRLQHAYLMSETD
ncbi:MalY/PatB family protein [Thioflexithrix psekupsensis]|uniref:MalY/PatB family protein n=1 Tax=Thioflexithrix psekupsensis TaxID=1570016 RepID=UPI001C3E79B5|nr:aminotransferase class I/II-fold pyridoxal phosphate-dependent enzyme [Thioflexithrix psekupsensis]